MTAGADPRRELGLTLHGFGTPSVGSSTGTSATTPPARRCGERATGRLHGSREGTPRNTRPFENHGTGVVTSVTGSLRARQRNCERRTGAADEAASGRASPAEPGSRRAAAAPCRVAMLAASDRSQTTLQKSLAAREPRVAATCRVRERCRDNAQILHSPSDPLGEVAIVSQAGSILRHAQRCNGSTRRLSGKMVLRADQPI
ncbi:uncharacterized protein LOC144168664 [Haemaphysalis longicornis]